MVLDNVRFHKAANIKAKEPQWQAKGLFLRYLPPYSPQLNPIEALWRVLRGFLLPRRLYDSLKDLKEAVFSVLATLNTRPLAKVAERFQSSKYEIRSGERTGR